MKADPRQVRDWLELLHGRSPGRVHVCAKGQWAGRATDDLDAAASYAVSLDDRQGVYLRCTTLRDGAALKGRGEAADSLALPGLWADLDLAGAGHKAPAGGLSLLPDEDAARAVIAHLSAPTLWVHSGGGLYPWWLLDEPHVLGDDLADVEALSTAWHDSITAQAARLGWHVGGTGDLSRVLRIPGTVNRKDGLERPCRIVEHDGPRYTLGELFGALPAAPPPVVTPPPASRSVWAEDLFSQPHNTPGPFDALGEHAAWRDLLEPVGYTHEGHEGDRELWKRPGATSDYSLKAGDHVATVWSTDAGLPAGKGQKLTCGRLFAHLHHRGDERAAALDLIAAAHDEPATTAARGLPRGVLDAIRQACPRPAAERTVEAAEGTPADDETPGQSWGAVALADVVSGLLDGTIARLAPSLGQRDGGGALFYAGKVNGVAGASGSGKSWTGIATAVQEIAAGRHVIYIDLEDDPIGMVGRLLDLGADPRDVVARFHYVQPDESYGVSARKQLLALVVQHQPSLVIIDSTGEGLALDGRKPNDDDDVARWFKTLPNPVARLGPAVIVLDHVVKADDGGLWPIGSQRKRAAITGAQYMQQTVRPFAKGQRGSAKLVCAKDRHGTYRPGEKAADLAVEPNGDGLTFALKAPEKPTGDAAVFRPTALMERVSRFLEDSPEPASRASVTDRVRGKRTALLEALDVLKAEGFVDVTLGARKAELCTSTKPYRQDTDPLSDRFLGTQERVGVNDTSRDTVGPVPTRSSRKEEERGTGENRPPDPFPGTGQERVRNGSGEGADACVECGQRLLLRRPGRDRCERCRTAPAVAAS